MKTAVDADKPSVVSKILTLTRVHVHLMAALQAEMHVLRNETEFRYSRFLRQSGEKHGQISAFESRRKVGKKRVGSYLKADYTTTFTCCVA